ncbi:MAG TPA: HDOD domain-containing protein [Spirochaetota bacterium]|nr:HDOD domain-containing protein [Spirochaetota bacterium]
MPVVTIKIINIRQNTEMETGDFFTKPSDFKSALESGEDFYIQFKKVSPEADAQIIKILHKFLGHYDLLYHKETIASIIRELVNNAIKANLKRIYFEQNGLNINDVIDYRVGMENFKEEVFQNKPEHYAKSLAESKYVVRVNFSARDNNLIISVLNNASILESEVVKIKARASKAFRYADISEAFQDVLDDSEGAGLGLIMAMMLLRSSGFPRESFTISRKENITVMSISIPLFFGNQEVRLKIADEITKEVEEIPTLPAIIKEIRNLCRNPESDIKTIANAISKDPGLTASIIKLSNSAGYMHMNRIETIEEAVKVVGMRGINTLLIATGVHKIVEKRYHRFESIWNESNRRAFYAQNLIKRLENNMRYSDQVFLAALLADIGKIVMLSLETDLLNRLKKLVGFKGIEDSTLLEEMSLGISHSSLGALICKKWNFNENLIKIIEFHHRPHIAPPEVATSIYSVYLADIFVEIENKKSRFEFVDEDVLARFNISQKEAFERLHRELKEKYIPY